jgi:transcriptional regulator with GAF, ATPase, and Fis domain
VNCGAIPSELLESLLFGHRKGAFTGAHTDQTGKFQLADGGTLFLDEIGDLPENLQVKLLRVLQEKTVEPLGSQKPVKVDVRVIAATHKNLSRLVEEGRFREDLFYRIAEMRLEIPPLRDRPCDIPLLATLFLKKFARQKRFSQKGWEWLKVQEWRGNVRELMSCIKRASVLSTQDEIQQQDLKLITPVKVSDAKNWLGGRDLDEAKNSFLREKVRQALSLSSGNRTKAADLLGVTPRTLFRYLEEFGDMTDASV